MSTDLFQARPRISKQEILSFDVALSIDACGLQCPLPLLRAKQGLRNLEPGDLLRISATDRGSFRDFHSFADISGHKLEGVCETDGVYIYLLRKSHQAS